MMNAKLIKTKKYYCDECMEETATTRLILKQATNTMSVNMCSSCRRNLFVILDMINREESQNELQAKEEAD